MGDLVQIINNIFDKAMRYKSDMSLVFSVAQHEIQTLIDVQKLEIQYTRARVGVHEIMYFVIPAHTIIVWEDERGDLLHTIQLNHVYDN